MLLYPMMNRKAAGRAKSEHVLAFLRIWYIAYTIDFYLKGNIIIMSLSNKKEVLCI